MTDVKYPSLSLTSTIPIGLSEDARTEMYKKLNLPEVCIEFLESPAKEKFLTRFEIGVDKIVMYGSPIHMSLSSPLVKSLLDIEPPYYLASNMTVYGGAITILWCYLNQISTVISSIENLSFKGWLNLANREL